MFILQHCVATASCVCGNNPFYFWGETSLFYLTRKVLLSFSDKKDPQICASTVLYTATNFWNVHISRQRTRKVSAAVAAPLAFVPTMGSKQFWNRICNFMPERCDSNFQCHVRGHLMTMWTQFFWLRTYLYFWTFLTLLVNERHFLNTYPPLLST